MIIVIDTEALDMSVLVQKVAEKHTLRQIDKEFTKLPAAQRHKISETLLSPVGLVIDSLGEMYNEEVNNDAGN